MKYTLTIELDNDEDMKPYTNAVKNQILIDGIYDAVFRPVIKYSDIQEECDFYSEIWGKLEEYLNDDRN